jgi:predicted secreted protein
MSGTTAYKGREGTLQISANGGSTFTTIGGYRNASVTVNNNPVDITNVGSGGFQEMLADGGTQSVGISFDGIVIDNTPLETLMAQGHDRTSIHYKFNFASGGIIAGQFVVVSINYGAAHDGAQTFSAQISSNGVVSFSEPT